MCTAVVAFAEWIVDFRDIYLEQGIDQAVIEALKQGAKPDEIMKNGLELDGINPQNLIKAMYCAGIRGRTILRLRVMHGKCRDMIIVAGYKKSVEECGDQVIDTPGHILRLHRL